MAPEYKAPILSYAQIRTRAEAFLARHHASGTVPVPIEEIVEFQLGLDIFPLPSLRTLLEIDGFLTGDLKQIVVDEDIYLRHPNRYRFTLAHEVGHVELHAELYRSAGFETVEEWKRFVNSIPEETHGWLEYQAYAFAGLVLVPSEPLDAGVRECIESATSLTIDLAANEDYLWEQSAHFLAKRFQVSAAVIEKRLLKDDLRERYRLPQKKGRKKEK